MRKKELGGLLVRSPAMRDAYELCRLYARVDRCVVFMGPVGSGKTTLAEAVHRASGRSGRFVVAGSGELSKDLSLDTLFGHMAGAFTGATCRRHGLVAEASLGTLLLDDLALMPKKVQAAILRLMESRRFKPLGAVDDQIASCRLLFATTVDPQELVASHRLLPDLESRLGEFRISVPSLASRREDILPLSIEYAQEMVAELGWEAVARFDHSARRHLLAYGWLGNVRELRHVVERGMIHAGPPLDGVVEVRTEHLPERITGMCASGHRKMLTAELVQAAIRRNGGNKSAAARELRVHRNTLYGYDLEPQQEA